MSTPIVTPDTAAVTGRTGLIIAVGIGLVALLIASELASATKESRLHIFAKRIYVGILPLLIAFAFIVVIKMVQAV